jgi:hypothetical protein
LGSEKLGERRPTRATIGSSAKGRADRGDVGQLLIANRRDNGAYADIETGTNDHTALFLCAGCPTGKDL